jgi:transposase-like protein
MGVPEGARGPPAVAVRAGPAAQAGPEAVLETALKQQMIEHLGHARHRAGRGRSRPNVRKTDRPKTVRPAATEPVPIEVPRNRDVTSSR